MTIPRPDQTVHLMSRLDVLRVRRDLRRKEGRNAGELELYTTDGLRRLYQGTNDDLIRLRDGIVSRVQLVAEIRWRIFWAAVWLWPTAICVGDRSRCCRHRRR